MPAPPDSRVLNALPNTMIEMSQGAEGLLAGPIASPPQRHRGKGRHMWFGIVYLGLLALLLFAVYEGVARGLRRH